MMKSYIISMALALILITILNICLNKGTDSIKEKIKWQHYFFGYLFILYLMIALKDVVGFPSISDFQGALKVNKPIFNPIINFIPFSNGIEISAILNIIFFMPFGFLLPVLWQKFRRFLPILCAGVVFSLIIEIGQLFTHRASDIDDLIMNVLGAILGWIIFMVMSKIFYKLSNKTAAEPSATDSIILKLEPYIYIVIAIMSTFLS
ncbi:VanZ family protein [Clostridium sardiniense]|uniref:VanZ family protein n=1 Tax=Clostridium sardiniense TaxID=29369 RepID=UPI003D352986